MKPLVIAHRGASAERPENTLSAYALAVEQRADMIEIDLHRTRDGGVVITHEEELGGLGGEGAIEDALLADVRALDAGGGEPVPTLDEVLDGFGERIPFNLELKRGVRALYDGLEAMALDAVRDRGLLAKTLFSSFFDPVLEQLRALESAARIAFLCSPRDAHHPLERARAVGAEALNPWQGMVTRELVDTAHAEGLAVYPFTVDDPERMRQLLEWGVDGLFTNCPGRMRRLVGHQAGS
ncbi:MAG: glycerophosphodiester phosphodiesterase [Myxococcota bacterium]|nr:glycerophosphodiester phosphodiesterase [bacterium]MDP6073829.1 glycerophosphodiester phosphodiesterase [Myxococcota bacterium]MDP6244784.1 glycerophosphodiester phosphodiesterase [Myxococcota bacterium]MDP7073594.1 glycerophosphodiester phosphodiesterase [Myxococcota bacterium]MDP7298124.1 glycerophosphodiester phosphodiesterase [Myxococcota bacterium]